MPRVTGTKKAILEAALQLAATKGITGTTMDEVAELAGVAKGSVYYNFTNKDQLFEELMEQGVGALAEVLREARSGLHGWSAIEALVDTLLGRIQENSALAKLMAAEMFRTDRAWQKTLFALRHEALGEFAAAIAESAPAAKNNGTSELMASSVFGAVLMGGLEWLVFEPERSREEVAATILQALGGQLRPA
ncbi:TetR/AcrR family transcriptional regulator [Leifsonia kafniensis]|uniref:TetR/AcrR family transcriptional regulator n=1 Tax=Leifsonia kafniensis TaxID=475957 RepID=A0ABP7L148_9MICO